MNNDLDLVVRAFTKSAAEYGEDRDKDKKGRGETTMPSPGVLWLESTADAEPEKAKPKEEEPTDSENDDVEYTDKRSSLVADARAALSKSASGSVFTFNPFHKQALREIERPNVFQRFGEGATKGTIGGGLAGAGVGAAHGLYARHQMKQGPLGEMAFGGDDAQRKILMQSILHGARSGAGLGGLGMGIGQAALGARERPGDHEFTAKDLAAEPGELPSATKKPAKKEETKKPETVKQALREMQDRGLLERMGAGATQGGLGGAVGGAALGGIGGAIRPVEEGMSPKTRLRRALAGGLGGGLLGGGIGAAGGALGEGALGDRKKLGDELQLQTGKRTPKPQGALGGIGDTIGSGLGTIGGGSMRGLGAVLGKLGLGGAEGKLNEWADNPTTSKWVGGGVTAAGTLAAALLAKKYLGGGGGEEEADYGDDSMYAEAAFHGAPPMQKMADPSGVALAVKSAIFGGGSSAPPFQKEENKAAKGGSDWRRGLTQRSGHRQTNFDRTDKWSAGK